MYPVWSVVSEVLCLCQSEVGVEVAVDPVVDVSVEQLVHQLTPLAAVPPTIEEAPFHEHQFNRNREMF